MTFCPLAVLNTNGIIVRSRAGHEIQYRRFDIVFRLCNYRVVRFLLFFDRRRDQKKKKNIKTDARSRSMHFLTFFVFPWTAKYHYCIIADASLIISNNAQARVIAVYDNSSLLLFITRMFSRLSCNAQSLFLDYRRVRFTV